MSTLLIALVLSAPPVDTSTTAGKAETSKSETAVKADVGRGYHEIAKDMRDTLKREALAKSKAERAEALCDLCVLYRELARDPRLALSDALKEYKTTIWSRLSRSKNEIKAQLAREKRNATKGKKLPAEDSDLLSAQAGQASDSLSNQLALVSYSLGGPAKVFAEGAQSYSQSQAGGAFGGMTRPDYGQDLVNLIERTIAPDSWDVNGGPGTIVYYPGLMALVVRATSEVHRDIGGGLDALRQAGP